ncbi:unnamed protein product [Rotaria sp. Silwood2]|nr:unnamed protein product [Rotaria sp. Silwood2]CAF3309964.1 unnamed protein product [Rotaria sp. Silwood2]CAF3370425.1 unnamed protein product [Rotaria sp. Silwood2]
MQNIVIDQYVQENGGIFSYKDNELPDLRDRLRKKFYNVTLLIKQKMIHASTDTSRPSSMSVTTVGATGYSSSCVPKPSASSFASDFMEKDYYQILGVHRKASDSDIISAYQQLAPEFHPSRNPTNFNALSIFNELGEAYDVLIDSNKRGIYDRYGIQGLKNGVPIEPNNELTERYVFHGDGHKVFQDFFPDNNPYENLYASAYARAAEPAACGLKRKHDAPLYRNLEVSLENCYHGGTLDVTLTRRVMLVDGTSTTPQKVVPITIERGCLPGTQILLEGEGDQYSDGTSSDLILVIRDQRHPHFRRENVDLIYKATISLAEALTDTTLYIQQLDGRQLEVPINEIVTPGFKQRVSNAGMPSTSNPGTYGDLIIEFEVQYPNQLSPEKKVQLQQILSKRPTSSSTTTE